MSKSIGELLESFFSGKLPQKAPLEARVWEAWQRIVGPDLAKHTASIRIRGKKCIVQIREPLLRMEVQYRAPLLLELLHAAGFPEIERIQVSS
ncbi:MAG: DUF721 domain-containing protein [Bacteroidia bacterium]|nr:DUF721 domain-containing protein [Bacteroidia bacterium]MDW8014698.1 DUF721 domain-containing protein [Bacteroidia bacterium]